jgi:hypothetical protein
MILQSTIYRAFSKSPENSQPRLKPGTDRFEDDPVFYYLIQRILGKDNNHQYF